MKDCNNKTINTGDYIAIMSGYHTVADFGKISYFNLKNKKLTVILQSFIHNVDVEYYLYAAEKITEEDALFLLLKEGINV